jgi:hypothetical protein
MKQLKSRVWHLEPDDAALSRCHPASFLSLPLLAVLSRFVSISYLADIRAPVVAS